MKKLIPILLAALLLTGILAAGCANSDRSNTIVYGDDIDEDEGVIAPFFTAF